MIRASLIFLVLVPLALATTPNWSCDFSMEGDDVYTCSVVEDSSTEKKDHLENKSNGDVTKFSSAYVLPRDLFKVLPNVEDIGLVDFFEIEKLSEGYFDGKGLKLRKFDTQHINVAEVGENAFEFGPNLESIDMSSNLIKTINKDAFRGLNKLQYLYLGGNSISELDGSIFQDLINLEILHLSYNNLVTLDANLFKNNKQLGILKLSHNPFKYIPPQAILNLPEQCYVEIEEAGCIDKTFTIYYDFDATHPAIDAIKKNCSSTI